MTLLRRRVRRRDQALRGAAGVRRGGARSRLRPLRHRLAGTGALPWLREIERDGMSWGVFPLFFASYGLGVGRIGILKAVYPAVWGVLQVATGPLSDRWGRKGLIVGGMWVQAGALFVTVLDGSFGGWVLGSILLGLGTAMVYPALIAAVSDASH